MKEILATEKSEKAEQHEASLEANKEVVRMRLQEECLSHAQEEIKTSVDAQVRHQWTFYGERILSQFVIHTQLLNMRGIKKHVWSLLKQQNDSNVHVETTAICRLSKEHLFVYVAIVVSLTLFLLSSICKKSYLW